MSITQDPANAVITYTEAGGSFASDITSPTNSRAKWLFRKIYCIGGTSVVFEDMQGNTVTVLAADYAAINNQAIYVSTIKAATDCTTLYASK